MKKSISEYKIAASIILEDFLIEVNRVLRRIESDTIFTNDDGTLKLEIDKQLPMMVTNIYHTEIGVTNDAYEDVIISVEDLDGHTFYIEEECVESITFHVMTRAFDYMRKSNNRRNR